MSAVERQLLKERNSPEWLELGGEFTVEQLREFGLGAEIRPGERPIRLVTEIAPTRYIPGIMVETARANLGKRDTAEVLRYLQAGFFYYRNCVNRGIEAPHLLVNGACEWPPISHFSWENLYDVIFLGELTHGPEVKNPTISVIENGKLIKTDLVTQKRWEREVVAHLDEPEKTIKFKIDRLGYANPIYWALKQLAEDSSVEEKTVAWTENLLEMLGKPYNFLVARYALPGEKPNIFGFFF